MAQAKQAHRSHVTITFNTNNHETMTKIYYKPACRAKAPRIPQIHSLYYKLVLLNLNKVLRKCWKILVEIVFQVLI